MVNRTYIIAEAGVNHNGKLELAKQLINVAVEAGADVVKFQTFKAENLSTRQAAKAGYQIMTTGSSESQFNMLKRLELSRKDHEEIYQYCKNRGIDFLSSPFDTASIDMLIDLGMEQFKIPSGEITNLPYLRKMATKAKKMILSTGMATLGEIEGALAVLDPERRKKKSIVILHCNTEYPTPMTDVNLTAMNTLSAAFPGYSVGYSDHTTGIEVAIAAVALGATVIEKHFTLDKNLSGPDHLASLDPSELKTLIQAIRNVEKALGNGVKRPSASEVENIPVVRKSIVAAKDIKKDDIFSEENLCVKRPGTGTSPMRWDEFIGHPSDRDYQKDEFI